MVVLGIFILILLNGVFSMSEIALISSRKSKLEMEAKNGNAKAEAALKLIASPNKFLSTVQIGITLISILTGIFSGDSLKDYIIPWFNRVNISEDLKSQLAVAIITIIVTFFSLVFGELVPKRIGMAMPERISMAMAKPMTFLSRITSPFIKLLSRTSGFFVKLLGIKDSNNSVTEEEIKSLVQEGASGGSIEEIEHEIVQRVFHLGDRKITSLMTNINEVTYLDIDDTADKNFEKVLESKHSVYPVCNDGINNMVGLFYVKDILGKSLKEEIENLYNNVRPPLYIPENNHAYQVLEKFQESRIHFGVIVDEYGNVQGIVTMNDIVDALVGDISETNEFEYEIVRRDDGSFLIDASLPFDEFVVEFDVDIKDRRDFSGFDTMGGFALEILGEIPKNGEVFEWDKFKFEIVDMDKNRIDKILIYIKEDQKETSEDNL